MIACVLKKCGVQKKNVLFLNLLTKTVCLKNCQPPEIHWLTFFLGKTIYIYISQNNNKKEQTDILFFLLSFLPAGFIFVWIALEEMITCEHLRFESFCLGFFIIIILLFLAQLLASDYSKLQVITDQQKKKLTGKKKRRKINLLLATKTSYPVPVKHPTTDIASVSTHRSIDQISNRVNKPTLNKQPSICCKTLSTIV